jgi:hypothetical protein
MSIGKSEHAYLCERIEKLELEAAQLKVAVGDRLQTILDEAFGPFETLPTDDLLTLLERKLFDQRQENERLSADIGRMAIAVDLSGIPAEFFAKLRTYERELSETQAQLRTALDAGEAAELRIVELRAALAETKQFTDMDMYCQLRELREAACAVIDYWYRDEYAVDSNEMSKRVDALIDAVGDRAAIAKVTP